MRVVVRTTAPFGSLMVIELPDNLAAFFNDDGKVEIGEAYPELWHSKRGWKVFK